MSRYFVNDPPVPIYEFDPATVQSDVPPNVIAIRARMDVATRAKVQDTLIRLGADGQSLESHLGENVMALLMHNIVAWSGPDFDHVPCDAAHIRTLDPNEPHVADVIAEITARNQPRPSPNPKYRAANGSGSAGGAGSNGSAMPGEMDIPGESLSLQLATGTYTLHSPNDSAGRRGK